MIDLNKLRGCIGAVVTALETAGRSPSAVAALRRSLEPGSLETLRSLSATAELGRLLSLESRWADAARTFSVGAARPRATSFCLVPEATYQAALASYRTLPGEPVSIVVENSLA